MADTQVQKVIVAPTKSVGISIILTFLLGPLGMFYSTIIGGVVMLIVSVVVAVVTFGIGLVITWPICILWGAVATAGYNKKLMATSAA